MKIKTKARSLACALVAGAMLVLAGCASDGYNRPYNNGYAYNQPPPCNMCGTVTQIQQVYVDSDHSTLGTVIGALVGAAVGNQVGSGNGKKLATVGGAVAGGAIGHEVGERNGATDLAWQITVRLNDGRYATVTQEQNPRVRVGDYVQVRGDEVYLR
ncbi:MAG TPA: glycine zipper 2TM domain-containing protein [Rhodanobacteraceae bacterium]|nr:glycine zipper 2TM domain-containing protein [Rhodanobacteraceae bacterium]